MIKTVSMMALAAAATVVAASPAFADVTCTPGGVSGVCTGSSTGTFSVSPTGIGPGFKGPISASIADSGIAAGKFTDTFSFILPYTGNGGGSVTSIFSGLKLHTVGDLDFSSIAINGITVAATIINGRVSTAFTNDPVLLNAGKNSIQILGTSYGNSSYGGSIAIVPAVPELATWGMMILGFGMMGSAMRYRRRSTKTSFA